MENFTIYKREGYYSAFPVLDHLADDRLVVGVPSSPFKDHHAVCDWIPLVSADQGQSWSPTDDPLVPATWPGQTTRERYDRFAVVMPDGTFLCTGAEGFQVWSADRRAEAEEGRMLVTDHPDDENAIMVQSGLLFIQRSTDGGTTWQREEVVPYGVHRLMGFPRAARLSDGSILVPIKSHYVWRSDDGDSWRLIQKALPEEGGAVSETAYLEVAPGRVLSLSRADDGFVQTWSDDYGRTWSTMSRTAIKSRGTPPHLLMLRDGRLLCSYGHRQDPKSICAVVSHDQGRSWNTANTITVRDGCGQPGQLSRPPNPESGAFDFGYAMTTQLADDSLYTVYYLTLADGVTHIAGTRWWV